MAPLKDHLKYPIFKQLFWWRWLWDQAEDCSNCTSPRSNTTTSCASFYYYLTHTRGRCWVFNKPRATTKTYSPFVVTQLYRYVTSTRVGCWELAVLVTSGVHCSCKSHFFTIVWSHLLPCWFIPELCTFKSGLWIFHTHAHTHTYRHVSPLALVGWVRFLSKLWHTDRGSVIQTECHFLSIHSDIVKVEPKGGATSC